jgi:predicted branched-subunit amino acid permease
MITPFDLLTVACFIGVVIAFFRWTEREPRTLVHLLLCGVVFAVANQLGNDGSTLFALVLVVAGVGYSVLVIKGQYSS